MDNQFLLDLLQLPTYDEEARNWTAEMVRQKNWVDAEYFARNGELAGEWLRADDVIELLKKHKII